MTSASGPRAKSRPPRRSVAATVLRAIDRQLTVPSLPSLLFSQQLETFSGTVNQIRKELDETRAAYTRERDRAAALQASAAKASSFAKAPNAVDDDLRLQVKDLVQELNSLSIQNDQLHTEADRQRDAVAAAEARAREMEKKWKAAKTELRNLKGAFSRSSAALSDQGLTAHPDS